MNLLINYIRIYKRFVHLHIKNAKQYENGHSYIIYFNYLSNLPFDLKLFRMTNTGTIGSF